MAEPHYVPIEDRWLGLDKRAIPYAAVMIAVIALLAYVLPAVNDAVDWTDETTAGELIDLGDGLTIAPPVGWLLEEGIRTSDEPNTPVNPDSAKATVANGGVSVSVAASTWAGTADELMDQTNTLRESSDADEDKLFKVAGDRSTVTASGGISGVSEPFTSATGDGKVYALVVPAARQGGTQVGVVVTATGSGDNLATYDSAISEMVSTLTKTEAAS